MLVRRCLPILISCTSLQVALGALVLLYECRNVSILEAIGAESFWVLTMFRLYIYDVMRSPCLLFLKKR